MPIMKKILRIGTDIYTVDMANQQTKVCTSDTSELASWVAYALAAWHHVSLEEREE